MHKLDIAIIEKYLQSIIDDEFHRYKSWDRCFKIFKSDTADEYHSLELAFYLASWGMYRGSSGLLQKNHRLHDKAIEILYLANYQQLKCNEENEITINSIELILELKKELTAHYSSINFTRGGKTKFISATDTLISKIMLGTFACLPAYDQYFIAGLEEMNIVHKKFNENSFNELLSFVEYNAEEIKNCQDFITENIQLHYPVMKIIDIYFWQIGFDKNLDKE